MEHYSLRELNLSIKKSLNSTFRDSVWVSAEIVELQNHSSGHCYLQLAEKLEQEERIIASARATIWASTYNVIKSYFEQITRTPLSKGMKVLVRAEVVFHEIYGYSLNIKDIDPTYTLGDLERKKQEILDRLEKEGIINCNRELEFPLLPKRIAVISSPTAAGYGDFTTFLQENKNGFVFEITLFQAILQGDKTAMSVIQQLQIIGENANKFDVVVLIRGGGAQLDLTCFDHYELAKSIALFPLPVITGIGHERDDTIADRVSYLKVKTPTAAASYLVDCYTQLDDYLDGMGEQLKEILTSRLREESILLDTHTSRCQTRVKEIVSEQEKKMLVYSQKGYNYTKLFLQGKNQKLSNARERAQRSLSYRFEKDEIRIERWIDQCKSLLTLRFDQQNQRIRLAEITQKHVDPKAVLQRGYSISRAAGKAIRSSSEIPVGAVIETELYDGKLTSQVINEKP